MLLAGYCTQPVGVHVGFDDGAAADARPALVAAVPFSLPPAVNRLGEL